MRAWGADLSARAPGDRPRHGFWHNAWQVFQVVQARLRFIALIAVLGFVLGSWGTLSNYWEKWTRPAVAQAAALQATPAAWQPSTLSPARPTPSGEGSLPPHFGSAASCGTSSSFGATALAVISVIATVS